MTSGEGKSDASFHHSYRPFLVHSAPLSHSRGSFDTERSEVEEETVVSGERV